MISIAPMVDVTDRHFRYLCRLLSKEVKLYTEMITAPAIINGNKSSLLDFNINEKPLVLQIAGSSSAEITEAIKIAEGWDYDEINLNVGCPSSKVSEHDMGLSLMKNPKLVAEIASAMRSSTNKIVSIKHRLGVVDKMEDINQQQLKLKLRKFISIVAKSGIQKFIIHARIGVLNLDTKKNRSVPELDYAEVYKIKEEFPDLDIEINGGISSSLDIIEHLKHVDSVMLGRIAYENPLMLLELDSIILRNKVSEISDEEKNKKRILIIKKMIKYISKVEKNNENSYPILKHLQNFYYGQPGSKLWRQMIGSPWDKSKKASEILQNSLYKMLKY